MILDCYVLGLDFTSTGGCLYRSPCNIFMVPNVGYLKAINIAARPNLKMQL